jgi:hypothetical protein
MQMTRQIIGILGCVLLVVAGAFAAALVFFETTITEAGLPYHFTTSSLLVLVLFGMAGICTLCGHSSRLRTLAAYATFGLALLFVGYVGLVLIAFRNG